MPVPRVSWVVRALVGTGEAWEGEAEEGGEGGAEGAEEGGEGEGGEGREGEGRGKGEEEKAAVEERAEKGVGVEVGEVGGD